MVCWGGGWISLAMYLLGSNSVTMLFVSDLVALYVNSYLCDLMLWTVCGYFMNVCHSDVNIPYLC